MNLTRSHHPLGKVPLKAKTEEHRRPAGRDQHAPIAHGLWRSLSLRHASPMTPAGHDLETGPVHKDGHATAEAGTTGSPVELPHRGALEAALGDHDLGSIKAFIGGPAAEAASELGAVAYTRGDRIAFREPPDLHTAAHETAHVLQQRKGMPRAGNIGQPGDSWERQADALADAVVQGRPVSRLAPSHQTPAESAPPSVQLKDSAEDDVDAIGRAGERAQEHSDDDTRMMLDGSSIVFRLLRTFYPEYLAKWNFSGVGYERALAGIRMQRTGNDVEVKVGRDFILDTKGRGLSSRVIEVGVTLEGLEGPAPLTSASTSTAQGPADRSQAIDEAGRVLAQRAKFGLAGGTRSGPDPRDSYDARYWKETNRSLEATVEPWIAMSQMVAHLDDQVPKQGGGTTRWRFDCFEGAEVERLYADWRMLSRDEFNRKNSPLKIGFMAYLLDVPAGTRPDYYEPAVKADPGGKPYRSGEEKVVRLPSGEYTAVTPKIPVGKSMSEVLKEAPVGAWIIWTNQDVTRRLLEHSKRKAAGETISIAEEELIERIEPWENENALKIGPDLYSAFPFGVVNEQTILEGMAAIVFDPNPVPAGYIEKNIYISAISAPR